MKARPHDNDNDEDLICFRLPHATVKKAAKLVEKFGPDGTRVQGSEGWWVYTNGLAYALGDNELKSYKQRIEKAAHYLRLSPITLYNEPLLQVEA